MFVDATEMVDMCHASGQKATFRNTAGGVDKEKQQARTVIAQSSPDLKQQGLDFFRARAMHFGAGFLDQLSRPEQVLQLPAMTAASSVTGSHLQPYSATNFSFQRWSFPCKARPTMS